MPPVLRTERIAHLGAEETAALRDFDPAKTSKASALARQGGRVVGTDTRNLSFVHQVPSNGEEHEKDSDDDPNIDAEH